MNISLPKVNIVWSFGLTASLFTTSLLMVQGCNKGTSPTGSSVASNPSGSSAASGAPAGNIKLGFLVKQPEEPWFQNEWKFADQAASKYKFSLIKIGAPDGEKALSAIDNLAAQGAQGFVICTPDVKLGPAIVAKAQADNLKVFTVDDRFVGAGGKSMNVPYMGISAREIGKNVGKALLAEMKKRGWKTSEVGVCAMTFEELDTARERTDGAIEALTAGGFPKGQIYKGAQKTSDTPGGFDAANIVLTQHGNVKKWLVLGMNDEAVLGAVRAMEGSGLGAADVIGIGIGGSTGVEDFKKAKPTGFFGSMLISPRRHGFETTEMLYKWVKDGKEPPKETFTTGQLITRDNYKEKMKAEGLDN